MLARPINDSTLYVLVNGFDYLDKFVRAFDLTQYVPESSVNGVEGLGQIYDYVDIFMLFATFLLQLFGDKDRVTVASAQASWCISEKLVKLLEKL